MQAEPRVVEDGAHAAAGRGERLGHRLGTGLAREIDVQAVVVQRGVHGTADRAVPSAEDQRVGGQLAEFEVTGFAGFTGFAGERVRGRCLGGDAAPAQP